MPRLRVLAPLVDRQREAALVALARRELVQAWGDSGAPALANRLMRATLPGARLLFGSSEGDASLPPDLELWATSLNLLRLAWSRDRASVEAAATGPFAEWAAHVRAELAGAKRDDEASVFAVEDALERVCALAAVPNPEL